MYIHLFIYESLNWFEHFCLLKVVCSTDSSFSFIGANNRCFAEPRSTEVWMSSVNVNSTPIRQTIQTVSASSPNKHHRWFRPPNEGHCKQTLHAPHTTTLRLFIDVVCRAVPWNILKCPLDRAGGFRLKIYAKKMFPGHVNTLIPSVSKGQCNINFFWEETDLVQFKIIL